ncbi:hypothetical protein [Neisseria musculi]|uniref:hypothetical protein n=1 Tax=Neisseria musculi TaxID=1815583 RepID=UPI00164B8B61|nr:hypothetical protein [Neisseria musculi]
MNRLAPALGRLKSHSEKPGGKLRGCGLETLFAAVRQRRFNAHRPQMQTKGGNLPPLSGQTPIQRRPPKPLQNSKKHHKKFYLPLRPPAREAGYSAFQNFFIHTPIFFI